jgi:hypothetical protein
MSDPEPRSKSDYARLWIEIMRRQLRGEWPPADPPPVDDDQLLGDDDPPF